MAKPPRRRLDPIQLVEAFYAPEVDDRLWGRGILEALAPIAAGVGLVASSMEAHAPGDVRLRVLSELDVGIDWVPEFRRFWSSALPAHVAFLRAQRSSFAALLSSVWRSDWDTWAGYRLLFKRVGLCDSFAIVAPAGGSAPDLQLHVPIPRGAFPPPPRSRQLLAGAASHLASAVRLRRLLPQCGARTEDSLTEAVLDPAGRVLHATSVARGRAARGHLVEAVRTMDRARGSLRWKSPEEALALWGALIDGRWSLVDHVDVDGRRYVLARRNPPDHWDPRALSSRERAVLALALDGRSNKAIGFDTRLAPSTIAGLLRSCQAKLGVGSRRALMCLLRNGADPLREDDTTSDVPSPSHDQVSRR